MWTRSQRRWCCVSLCVLQGVYSMHGATVPLYDTLGPDTVSYVINQTELTTVVVGPKVPHTHTQALHYHIFHAPGRRCVPRACGCA